MDGCVRFTMKEFDVSNIIELLSDGGADVRVGCWRRFDSCY